MKTTPSAETLHASFHSDVLSVLRSLCPQGRRARFARAAVLSVVVCLLSLSAARAATGPSVPGFEEYDRRFPEFLKRWNIPGASVAVAYKGRIVFIRGYGLADRDTLREVLPETPFRVMSVSKILTAATVMKLVEEGRLSLEDKVFDLLQYPTPTYSGAKRDARLSKITVRQLLSHTTGWVPESASNPIVGGRGFNPVLYQRDIARIMGAPSPASAETLIRYMVGQPLQAEPGTTYAYGNTEYLLLARLIELKTGASYTEAVKSLVGPCYLSSLAPAGSTRAELSPDEAVYYDDPSAPFRISQFDGSQVPAQYSFSLPGWDAAGGWKMSAVDCLRMLLALEGKNGLTSPLRTETVSQMRVPQSPAEYYGFGWFTKYACSNSSDTGHGGGSWGTKTWALRSSSGDWHWAVFLNSLPTSAFSDGNMEADAYATIHSVDASLVAQWPDFTWSTLSWSDWLRRWFGAATHAPLDDPNGDGVPLLLEYACGLSPQGGSSASPASLAKYPNGDTVLRYGRLPLSSEASWTVEVSEDGLAWRPFADGQAFSETLNADGTLSVVANVGHFSRARLRVTLRQTGTQAVFEPTVPSPSAARLTALSVRAESGAGDNVLIVGLLVAGNAGGSTKSVVVRGLGPALADAVPAYIRDPELKVYSADGLIGANDDWDREQLTPVLDRIGLNTLKPGSKDAALLSRFSEGGYTIHVGAKTRETGVAMAEIYEADGSEPGHLSALSVRASAGSGDKTLICGFIVGGSGTRRIVIRGLGPSLAQALGTGYLADPKIDLFRLAGDTGAWSLVKTNDNYEPTRELFDAFAAAGLSPLGAGSKDAALVADLAPGAYTVHLSGVNDTTGVALIEVYEVP